MKSRLLYLVRHGDYDDSGELEDRVKLASYNDMGHLPAELRGVDYPAELRI
jgi:hypothetical protein